MIERRKVRLEVSDCIGVEPVKPYAMVLAELVVRLGGLELSRGLVQIQTAGMPLQMPGAGLLDERPPSRRGIFDQTGKNPGDAFDFYLTARREKGAQPRCKMRHVATHDGKR